ncbi:hypothetical protein [Nocardioides sp. TF02-7]|uniref:hypothetical protein n=1 Tax=Nocardioides sp. TF02-7 TaxID=2917724 RepID=UPI001F0618D7|nr:hypothetical protein [Nocardioides sp. TF02-7]UMG94025.1 hypothetical protein MF408_08105 [Nocardioides sp. TF02-7]
MSEDRPQRVRVTGPPRQSSARPRSRLGDVHEQTPLGGVYLRSLLREQLVLAVGILVVVAVTIGALPLVFHLWPELADIDMAGLPLAWVLLGGLVYPFLLLLGWRYVRQVERNERDFADLVEGAEP